MKVAITGGTGFVGKALTKALIQSGHEVIILTRSRSRVESNQLSYVQWLVEGSNPANELEGTDIFVNLAGESINSGRWTEERKKSILNSRIKATSEVINIMEHLSVKPSALINASAVGFYGTSDTKTFTEKNVEHGDDFLADTVHKWEEKALEASQKGIRTVLCRFGIILDQTDGALPRMALPYRLFAGGTVGSGEQWLSWIHLDDVVKGILFVMNQEKLIGPVNFTAPTPMKMKEFGQTLGRVLNRPHWIPAPSFALKVILGEMSTLVLKGQKVMPVKLMDHQFDFTFTELDKALENIYVK